MRNLKNSKKFRIYKNVKRELGRRFPSAFPREGHRPTLKIGILADIRETDGLEISMTHCRRFLSIWTSSTAYLVGMTRGAQRVGLDGAVHGIVSETHQNEARQTLIRRKRAKARLTSCQSKT